MSKRSNKKVVIEEEFESSHEEFGSSCEDVFSGSEFLQEDLSIDSDNEYDSDDVEYIGDGDDVEYIGDGDDESSDENPGVIDYDELIEEHPTDDGTTDAGGVGVSSRNEYEQFSNAMKEDSKNVRSSPREDLETYLGDETVAERGNGVDFLPIDKKMWYASRSYLRHEGPVAAHLNSYNYAMCVLIPSIVETKGIATVEVDGKIHKTTLTSFYCGTPKHKENNESVIDLNPKLCMDRKISYIAPIFANLTYHNPNGTMVVKKKKCIGEFPVMVKSKICTLSSIKNDESAMAAIHEDVREVGGYFVIKGQRKVLIHQVKPAHNQISIYKGKNNNKNGPKFSIYAETRSGSSSSHTTNARVGILAKSGLLNVAIPYIDGPIPLGILFRALGVDNEKDMANYIFPTEWFTNPPTAKHKNMIDTVVRSLEQSYGFESQDAALNYIGKRGQKFITAVTSAGGSKTTKTEKEKTEKIDKFAASVSYTKHLLSNEYLPHIGVGIEFHDSKRVFVGYMAQKALFAHTGIIPVTDRDHFMNKRIHTSGMLIATQFYNAFRKLMTHITISMEKNVKNKIPVVASSYITTPYIISSSLLAALTSNKWSSRGQTQGISQAVDDFNFCAMLSCLRKFVIPLNADAGKVEGPRHVHGSQWMVACVTGDTLITLATGDQVPIKSLNNRAVMTVNPKTLKIEPSGIFNFFKFENRDVLRIEDEEGKTIRCTHDHPFFVSRDGDLQFIQAGDLKLSDLIMSVTNHKLSKEPHGTKIIKIEPQEAKEDVYDLTTISENHTLILNQMVTSNCPYKTPEGKQVGLVQGFAMGAYIAIGSDPEPIIDILQEMDIVLMKDIMPISDFLRYTRIFVNGSPQGYTHYPEEIVNQLRMLRQSASIDMEVSIYHDKHDRDILISTEAGRAGRAVALAPNGELKLTEAVLDEIKRGEWDTASGNAWIKLMSKGYTEILFKDEEEEMNVAIFPSDFTKMNDKKRIQYTHCELTPDLLEGAGVSTSPHNDHNQAPRNIYQEAMSHQSVGNVSNTQFWRKGKWHAFEYPQKPLVSTRISRELGFSDMPMWQNAMILVMPWMGFNQEDSLILHQQAVERGFGRTITYISFEGTLEHAESPTAVRYEGFGIPSTDCNDFQGFAGKLIQDGEYVYVPIGTIVNKDDILIGMIITGAPEKNSIFNKNKTNVSIRYDHKLPGVVHSIQCGFDGKGYKYIRLVVAQRRDPVVGDKFAGRHGQKGICGAILPTHKMPFLKKRGYTPDIIMNPLAFPSRMTIGMLLEMIMGVALTSTALQTDDFSRPLCFDDPDQKECMTQMLKEWTYPEGFSPSGEGGYEKLSGDASPWDKSFSLPYFFDALKRMGINEYSEEIVVNPETGTELVYPIFSAIAYYQRLKHMVVDKIHARARGNVHGLHRQPTEGRKKGGGFRIGHMERDFLIPTSPVALREGISVMIKQLDHFEQVWGWNVKKDGAVSSKQINFASGQSRPHYVMTLQDGRTIEASNNHPFYTEDGDYSDMKYLNVGTDRLACTINPPLVDIENEMELCEGWGWSRPGFFSIFREENEDISEYESFRRSLCLARLIGLVVSDGYVSDTDDNVFVHPDHQLDVDTVLADIFRLTGITAQVSSKAMLRCVVTIPEKLASYIRKTGVIFGNRINQEAKLPKFVNENTPLPILREFLGGLFGGDGHTVCISERRETYLMKSVCFSWSRNQLNIQSLQKTLELLQRLLALFGIDSTVQKEKLTTFAKRIDNDSDAQEIVLNISVDHLVDFSEKIGFRYCENKALKLSIGASYRRFRDNVSRQRAWICERVDEITDYRTKKDGGANQVTMAKARTQARLDLEKIEPILHEDSVPSTKMIGRLLLEKNNNNIRSTSFPTIDKYLEEIGVLGMFLNTEEHDDAKRAKVTYAVPSARDSIPSYHLKVIDIREKYPGAVADMCDITVESGIESYVVSGVVSHNCMLGQGTPNLVQDRLFHQSDAYKIPICSICGLLATDNGTRVECRLCNVSTCVMVDIPYGSKLCQEEFSVLNCVPRIITLSTAK